MRLLSWHYDALGAVAIGVFGKQTPDKVKELVRDPFGYWSPLPTDALAEVFTTLVEHPEGPLVHAGIDVLWAAQTSGHSWFVRLADSSDLYYRVTFGAISKKAVEYGHGATVRTIALPMGYADPY